MYFTIHFNSISLRMNLTIHSSLEIDKWPLLHYQTLSAQKLHVFMRADRPVNVTMVIFGPHCEKTCLQRFATNKGADQPVHLPSLISIFVILFLESIISRLAASEVSTF